MAPLFEAGVGFVAGLLGGLFGVGGSVLIIPGLIFYLSHTPQGYHGSQQHLIQAAAMVCNVFVAAPALVAHVRARALVPVVLRGLVPGAFLGMIAGVFASNSPFFARERGAYLAMVLAAFLAAEGLSHLRTLWTGVHTGSIPEPTAHRYGWGRTLAVGGVVGLVGGLLGIGGGTLSIPLQCRLLGVPLRSAIANSAATIIVVSTLGATYKTLTLPHHGFSAMEALRLAGLIVPTAVVGSYLGGQLTHRLPRRALEALLVIFFLSMAALTYSRAVTALRREPSTTTSAVSGDNGSRHQAILCQHGGGRLPQSACDLRLVRGGARRGGGFFQNSDRARLVAKLAEGLEDGYPHTNGQVEAACLRPNGYPQKPVAKGAADRLRQTLCFAAKDEDIPRSISHIGVNDFAPLAKKPHPFGGQIADKLVPVGHHLPAEVLPVIEPRPAQVTIGQTKTKRPNHPQLGSRGHAGPPNVARVVVDLRLIQHDV